MACDGSIICDQGTSVPNTGDAAFKRDFARGDVVSINGLFIDYVFMSRC